jgi:hypothetical protein
MMVAMPSDMPARGTWRLGLILDLILDWKDTSMQGSTAERGHELSELLKADLRTNPIYLWVTTTNHKRIGLMYIYTAFIFFLLGGIEALIMRTQLAVPNDKLVDPNLYDELFTMHGTVMILPS